MKKNIMMRISAVLLLAVLLTTCVISGTWAKYVSQGSASDSARVAKWGVTVTVTGKEAFAETYDDVANGTSVVSIKADDPNTKENVLAPGTNGTLGSASIAGQPEVKVHVSFALEIELVGWEIDGEFYCPLVFACGSEKVDGTDPLYADNKDKFIEDIQKLVAASYDVHANTNLATSHIIYWEWAFSKDKAHDEKDTKLANLATDPTTAPKITATWNVSVTQVD